jgi:two-component system OmpR family response regulator
MLTARNGEADRAMALELAADDYLAKAFLLRELLARIRSLLRRSRRQDGMADALAKMGACRSPLGSSRFVSGSPSPCQAE